MQEQSFFSRQAAKSAKKSVPQIWCSPKSIDESLCRFAGVGFVSCTRNYYNSAAYPTRVWRSSQIGTTITLQPIRQEFGAQAKL